jgi:hypothetical protein
MHQNGYIVVASDEVKVDGWHHDAAKLIDALEKYAWERLEALDIDITEAETTKVVCEADISFVEMRVGGIKFIATILDRDLDPENDITTLWVELRQH